MYDVIYEDDDTRKRHLYLKLALQKVLINEISLTKNSNMADVKILECPDETS